jgi:HlyD family secretion protein
MNEPFMPQRRFFWPLVISLIVGSIGALTILSLLSPRRVQTQPPNQSPPSTTRERVSALGRLEPQGEVIYLSAPASLEGARVERLLVKLGDRVKTGQLIAILDNRDRLQAAEKEARTQVKLAKAELNKIKLGAKVGEINAQKAKSEGLKAELAGQMATQSATIARIGAELNNAQTECRRYEKLFLEGAISASERDNICIKDATFREQLAEAQANRQRTINTLKQEISSASGTLTEIAEVRPVDVAIAQANLEKAQAYVQQAQANLNLAYVKAPRSGQILKIHTYGGERVEDKGIVELGDTEQMYVVAEIYETEIHGIKIGQIASITSKGLAGELTGKVAEIGLQIAKKDVLGTDPAADVDARVVEVKIQLDTAASAKVQGLTNLQVNVVINL